MRHVPHLVIFNHDLIDIVTKHNTPKKLFLQTIHIEIPIQSGPWRINVSFAIFLGYLSDQVHYPRTKFHSHAVHVQVCTLQYPSKSTL